MAMNKFKKLVDNEKVYFENKVRKLNQHLKRADKMNFKKVLIAGEDEVNKGEFFTKEL